MAAHLPPVLVDLTDPDLWREGVPHREFERLRSLGGLAWADHPGRQQGFWVASRHEDLVAISHDPGTFSSRGGVITLDDLEPDQLEARRTMLEEDPPRHRQLRSLTSPHFTPRAVRAHEDLIRTLAGDCIESALAKEVCDLVPELSERVPIRVLARILGVPDAQVDLLVDLGNQMIGSDDPEYLDPAFDAVPDQERRLLPFGHPAALQAFQMAWELARLRREEPAGDVLTSLALAEVDGEPLSDRELATYFVLLAIAGNETTRHTISSGVAALAAFPDEWRRLGAGAVDLNTAADEVIRWATAIHFHRRVATRDVRFGDVDIGAGEKVVLYFASGNYDERVFESPHRLDLGRSPNDHVSFGRGGPHFCLGAHLARLEVRIVLEELAARVSAIELAGAPVRLRSNHINGLKHLPVRLSPR